MADNVKIVKKKSKQMNNDINGAYNLNGIREVIQQVKGAFFLEAGGGGGDSWVKGGMWMRYLWARSGCVWAID